MVENKFYYINRYFSSVPVFELDTTLLFETECIIFIGRRESFINKMHSAVGIEHVQSSIRSNSYRNTIMTQFHIQNIIIYVIIFITSNSILLDNHF